MQSVQISRAQDPLMVDKAQRLIKYLEDAQRLRTKPVLSLSDYSDKNGKVVWFDKLPEHEAIDSTLDHGQPSHDEPFLSVERIAPEPPPSPPSDVVGLLVGSYDDSSSEPELRIPDPVSTSTGRYSDRVESASEGLPGHQELEEKFQSWLAEWRIWAEQDRRDEPVRKLYRTLYEIFTTISGSPDVYELILGIGCLSWRVEPAKNVMRHVLSVPAGIHFDDETGAITIYRADSIESMFIELDQIDPALVSRMTQYQSLSSSAKNFDDHPLNEEEVSSLLRRIVNGLHPEGRYSSVLEVPKEQADIPEVTFSPAIILRRRQQQGLVDVFEAISKKITETKQVPTGLLSLVDPDYSPSVASTSQPSAKSLGAMVEVDDEIFFPLPLNDRQRSVIQRLEKNAHVLVQGPPGTGKTHLAAALISHLLAQGKRVLVTARTDRALKEVRGKLPKDIKELAVSVLGASSDDMAELTAAVRKISEKVTEFDSEERETQFQLAQSDCLQRLDKARGERARLRNALVQQRSEETNENEFPGFSGTRAKAAQKYSHEYEYYAWFRDQLSFDSGVEPPLSGDDAASLLRFMRESSRKQRFEESESILPDVDALPDQKSMAALLSKARAAAATSGSDEQGFRLMRDLICSEAGHFVESEVRAIKIEINNILVTGGSWVGNALRDVFSGFAASWIDRENNISRLLERAQQGLRWIDPMAVVTISPDVNPAMLREQALQLHNELVRGKTIQREPDGSVKQSWRTRRDFKESWMVLSQTRVNGLAPVSQHEINQLLAYLDVNDCLNAVEHAWPSDMVIEREDTLHERQQWHIEQLGLLRRIVALRDRTVSVGKLIEAAGIRPPDWRTSAQVDDFLGWLNAARDFVANASATERLHGIKNQLLRGQGGATSDTWAGRLLTAIDKEDLDLYSSLRGRIREIKNTQMQIQYFKNLMDVLRREAPLLVEDLSETFTDPMWDDRLAHLSEAWRWALLGGSLKASSTADMNDVASELDEVENEIRDIVEELSTVRAWYHALVPGRISGKSRADLNNYARLVKRLGKGTGKYADQRRAEIKKAMADCRPAVPVWIMPIYRIAEQLKIEENMFDVVIVDEASQAGLEATFLQYLAPQIVVVGDDLQVSPASVGVDEQQMRDLADVHIKDFRYRSTWQDPKVSLFDAASIWYGNQITLDEHRRCVPEIIGFSNKIAYEPENKRLIPVRQQGSAGLPPVRPFFVPDGFEQKTGSNSVNKREAERLVEQLQRCIDDPRYQGKTMGVISLVGSVQARYIERLVLDRISPKDIAEREIRCGDATDFQGSERDVVFLSMVSSFEPGKRMGSLTKLDAKQRFNVAASRAKDQMWVFHSVNLEGISNPEDMRYKLLDYCYNTVQGLEVNLSEGCSGLVSEDSLVKPFDSLFEQRVYNRVVERGYTVIPQFSTLGYRIDMVVRGEHSCLAIECDGDYWHGPEAYLNDLARERDLHRNGWDFFRIRESDFYMDRSGSLERLWEMLEARGIKPPSWRNSESDKNVPASEVQDASDAQDDAGYRPARRAADADDARELLNDLGKRDPGRPVQLD